MRGAHVANFRRVLSLPTFKRGTLLLGRYRPPSGTTSSSNVAGGDGVPRRRRPSRPSGAVVSATAPTVPSSASSLGSAGGIQLSNGGVGTYEHPRLSRVGVGTPPTGGLVSFPTGGTSSRRSTINQGGGGGGDGGVELPGTSRYRSLNAAFDRNDIAASAALHLAGTPSVTSVEALLVRDIGRNVFRLPVPRLRMWLHNLDVLSIVNAALRHVYGSSCSPEKVAAAESVVSCKVEARRSPLSCRQAASLLKFQRVLVSKGLRSDLNLPVYRSCIQALNFRIGSMSGDDLVPLCHTLDELWQHLVASASLDTIADCHSLEEGLVDLGCLYVPLIGALERSLFNLSFQNLPVLLRLLLRLQRRLGKDALSNLHEVSFLRIVELAGDLPLDTALLSLRLTERVDSMLPLPLYFLCQQTLAKHAGPVHLDDFHLVVRCLARCSSVDLKSLKRVLLLYRAFTLDPSATVGAESERSVATVILRSFDVTPATKEAYAGATECGPRPHLHPLPDPEQKGTCETAIVRATTATVPLPRGFHGKVRSMDELEGLLLWAIGSLRRSSDPDVACLCSAEHVKLHYIVPASTRLSVIRLLETPLPT